MKQKSKPRRPSSEITKTKKQKIREHVKQLISLLAMQQLVTHTLEKEIDSE